VPLHSQGLVVRMSTLTTASSACRPSPSICSTQLVLTGMLCKSMHSGYPMSCSIRKGSWQIEAGHPSSCPCLWQTSSINYFFRSNMNSESFSIQSDTTGQLWSMICGLGM
jgi:hypothetical protein